MMRDSKSGESNTSMLIPPPPEDEEPILAEFTSPWNLGTGENEAMLTDLEDEVIFPSLSPLSGLLVPFQPVVVEVGLELFLLSCTIPTKVPLPAIIACIAA